MTTQEETVLPKKSKGQLFKEMNGYSKTFKRNMKKKGLDPKNPDHILVYKQTRKAKQRVERNVQVEKHSKASAIRKGGKK